jgi:tetratricopeptide (TPR) repeat protein
VRITRFTPNVIELQVVSTRSTAVVINQNFHPRWRSSRGAVTSHQGLLSVTGLPGGPPYTVALGYRSPTFLVGLALSIASVAGVLWLAVRRIRAHGVAGALQGVAPPDGWQPREVRIPYAAWCGRTRIVVAIAVCASLVALWLLAIPALRADYMLRAAELARAAGARDLAADLCGRVLQVDRDNGPAREILGACYHEEGRWREAAAELEWAARLGKLQAMSYYRLALSYERLGQLGDAERAWRTLVAVGPYDRLAWRALRARLAGPEPEAGLRPAPGAGGTRTRAIWQREAQ